MVQPISAEPGQPFGEAKAQRDSQRVLPLPSADTPNLDAPSARPTEAVTAGLPTGPGPGPEALAGPTGEAASNERMAIIAPGLLRLASLPGTHPDIRSLARRMRAAALTRR